MGTLVSSIIPRDVPKAVAAEVSGLFRSLEERLTVNGPPAARRKSQVNTINQAAGVSAVSVDADVYHIVSRGVIASCRYRESFNVLIGPVVKAWGIVLIIRESPTKRNN